MLSCVMTNNNIYPNDSHAANPRTCAFFLRKPVEMLQNNVLRILNKVLFNQNARWIHWMWMLHCHHMAHERKLPCTLPIPLHNVYLSKWEWPVSTVTEEVFCSFPSSWCAKIIRFSSFFCTVFKTKCVVQRSLRCETLHLCWFVVCESPDIHVDC